MDFLYKKIWTFLDGEAQLSEADPYRSALWLWKHFITRVSSHDEREKFETTLSQPQFKSWTILHEWWNATYHYDKPDEDEETARFIKDAEEKQEELAEPDRMGYHVVLSHLFVIEMVWYSRIKEFDAVPSAQLQARQQQILQQINDKLFLARKRALKQAVWQKIAHASHALATNSESAETDKAYLGSTLEVCPWLRCEGGTILRKPAYLWDRQARKSVKTCDIPEAFPAFYCVSHTWGRWRRGSVHVEGVDWAVPTNSRFDVVHLPEVFQRLDWPVHHIWFDLFCIPQEECPEQAEEIGKQADIFRRAACNVIWMHDVVGWKILEKSVMWLGLNYLHHSNPRENRIIERLHDLDTQLKEDFASLNPDVLLNPWAPVPESEAISETEIEFHERNPGSWWFSSLWTLQEAYLCPSSLLADRNWNLLSVGDSQLLTLDNLASIAYSPASDVADTQDRPAAVEVLIFTMKRWELTDLSSSSRMSLLIAAESRQSTGPRAEAIMSALGVTDWFEDYRKQHGRAPPQIDLVFKLYPLEFLHEAQRKIGGPFFLQFRAPPNTIEDAEIGEPLGTMLPLAYKSSKWLVTQSMNFSTLGWTASLSDTWLIQSDGTVVLKEAAILNVEEDDGPMAHREGPITISTPTGFRRFDSFRAWESELPRVPHRFAVAAVRYNYRQLGIILEGAKSSSEEGGLVLVKTGVFMTLEQWCGEDLIKVVPVNWRVL
jgi:hypothetical protein